MDAKKSQAWLFSGIGVIAAVVIAIAVNLLAQRSGLRIDTTTDKVFTLSDGTREILKGIDAGVTVRFYMTRDDSAMPVVLRAYGERVEDLLREYRDESDGKVEFMVLDPKPDSDAEDSAMLDGVQPQQIDLNDAIYFGLSFTSLDRKVAIPFLTPDRESLLEYDISRAIAEVTVPDKPKVGVLSGIEVLGTPVSMMVNPMMAPPQSDPWVVMRELQSLFEVEELAFDGSPIPEDIDLLVVIQPSAIDPATEYEIDQYLLRGGQMIVYLDPFCLVAEELGGGNPMAPPPASAATLPNLLKAWGFEFSSQIVADPVFKTIMSRGAAPPAPVAGVLSINSGGINPDDVLTSQMDSLVMVFAGAFEGEPADGLVAENLVESSDSASLVDRAVAEGDAVGATPAGRRLPLALRLNGSFKTAFPDGRPEPPATPDDAAPETGDDGVGTGEEVAESESLKRSEQDGAVILVGDVDMLFDSFAVEVQNILGQQLVLPINANIDLFLNGVEMLAGDSNLITIRSRGSVRRPFTVVREMEAAAEERYRDQIAKLETELTETQQRLNELQQLQPADGGFLLTPEQEAEVKKFEEKRAEVSAELKAVRRELREDVERLQSRIKWLNILAVPLLVVIAGGAFALFRKRINSRK